MVAFEELLAELGTTMGTDLHADKNRTCLLAFPDGIEVYLQPDKTGEQLIVGCKLGIVAAGTPRITLFSAALTANARPFPRFGNLAYSRHSDEMVLYEFLPLEILHGDNLAGYLDRFAQHALVWVNAIKSGRAPDFGGAPAKR